MPRPMPTNKLSRVSFMDDMRDSKLKKKINPFKSANLGGSQMNF